MSNKIDVFQRFLENELARRRMSMREFAAFLDVSPTTISKLMDKANPRKPGIELLMRLSEKTGQDIATLIEMAYPDHPVKSSITPSAKALAQQIEQLPDDDREVIITLLNNFRRGV